MSDLPYLTVMGPDEGSTSGFSGNDILAPMALTPMIDKFKWRKQIALWETTVKRFAKGGEKRAKGILRALGLNLFNALDPVFLCKVEKAITAGITRLDLDGEDEVNPTNQKKFVEEIIGIVAKDTLTDGIRRLVQMMRNAYGCTRKHGESTEMYTRRFQVLALGSLSHFDGTPADHGTQTFAIILLENAKIPLSVYSTVFSQVVSAACVRGPAENNWIYVISKERLAKIVSKENEGESSHSDESGEQNNTHDQTNCAASLKAIREVATSALWANQRHEKEDWSSFRVTLDDAVEVLSDLKVEDYEQEWTPNGL